MQDKEFPNRLKLLEERLVAACRRAGRDRSEISLLAVSKTRRPDELRTAHHHGLRCFGENYLDEAAAKQDQLRDLAIEWHYIGPIQSNKTRALAERFDWVQSVDRLKIVRRLGEQRPATAAPLNVLIQVNIDREPQKSGCAPDQIEALAAAIGQWPSLKLRGLMAIPAPDRGQSALAASFEQMRECKDRLRRLAPGSIDTLSMGMSADLEMAIAHGATMVRIGTALFGARTG
ncbi:MAG: YggS family pyridoxal phosphate-dependent enzyme [Wenzhouxiangellaceae bacterium]